MESVIGEVGECRLNLNSRDVESRLVRNICKSHAAGLAHTCGFCGLCPSVSLSACILPCGTWAGGRGCIWEGWEGLNVLAGS